MAITDINKVRFAAQITDEYTDEEILSEIDLVEADLYSRYKLPKRSQFLIDDDYTDFYIYPEKVHEVTRLQVQVDTSIDASGWLTIDSQTGSSLGVGSGTVYTTNWSHDSPNNYITLSSNIISTYDTKNVRVQCIPYSMHNLATYQSALNLVDTTNIIDGERVDTPITAKLKNRIDRYKKLNMPRKVMFSSNYEAYDEYEYTTYSQSDLR